MAQENIEIENVFSFDKLPKSGNDEHIISHGYEAYHNAKLPDFVCFKRTHAQDNHISRGYKFHISIDDPKDDDTNNFEKAWPIILKNLTDAQVADFKIVHGDARYQPQMQGKQVTIYAFKEIDRKAVPADDVDAYLSWQEVFQKLTNDLAKAGIRPGVLAITGNENEEDEEVIYDNKVKGSNFVSYRDDGLALNNKDPFKLIAIECKHQLDRKKPPVNNIKPALKNNFAVKEEINLENRMKQIDTEITTHRAAYQGTVSYITLYKECLRNNKMDDANIVRDKIDKLRQHLNHDTNKNLGKFNKEEVKQSIKHIDTNLKDLDKIYKEDESKSIFKKFF